LRTIVTSAPISWKEALERQAFYLERAVGSRKAGFMRRGKDGRPVVARIRADPLPTSAIELERQLIQRMPERQILAAIANTEHCAFMSDAK
jgi:hypothetical protein